MSARITKRCGVMNKQSDMSNDIGIRINKYLSEYGVCSRREADRLIASGRVRINGKIADTGERVSDGDKVQLDEVYVGGRDEDKHEGGDIGKNGSGSGNCSNDINYTRGGNCAASNQERGGRRIDKPEPVVLAFNKPRGIVCTSVSQDDSVNIIDYIGYKTRVFPIGRLDKDSEGLILLTNMGELADKINHARNHCEKEYVVRCTGKVSDEVLLVLGRGVRIAVPARNNDKGFERDGKKYKYVKTKPCKVYRIDDRSFCIILTQGLNRQIRRMCEALGCRVAVLKRIRIMNISLGALPEGRYRELSREDIMQLTFDAAASTLKTSAVRLSTDHI